MRQHLLLINVILAAVVALVAVPFFLLHVVGTRDAPSLAPPVPYGIAWLLLAVWTLLAAVLWSRRPLSMLQLRCVELTSFGLLALVKAWFTYSIIRGGTLQRFASPDGYGITVLAEAVGLEWFSLVVIYGVLAANTFRRCVRVVAVLASTPVVICLAAGVTDKALDGRALTAFLLWLGFWLILGAAVAVYGSHKISLLRHEVVEARKLGPYRLERRLGTGGMGEVYLAEHVLLRRPCAIKLIRAERAGDANCLRRLEREVQATATLTHPNTVQIFDYGHAEDGTFYYAMEYLPGLNLEELVRRHGPLPPERAIHLVRQVCGHARGACRRPDPPRHQAEQHHPL